MAARFASSRVDLDMPRSGSLSPIARQYLSGLASPQGPLILPGCTANEIEDKTVSISNEMLQAYVMMRGPGEGFGSDLDDPLLDWILLRDNVLKAHEKRFASDRKDITRMLSNVQRVLQSEDPPEESPQTSTFELQRPGVDHIRPPHGMDLSMHMLNACCHDFEFEDDETDEEEHIPRGRISPCTFLAWSEGCRLWKRIDARKQDPLTDTAVGRRQPITPTLCVTPPSTLRRDRHPRWYLQQECAESGAPLSPHYEVPSSPSVLWDAEGIDGDRMAYNPEFEDHYRRMDYKAAKKLQQLKQFGTVETPTTSCMSQNESFSSSIVNEIIADDMNDLDPNAGLEAAKGAVDDRRARIVLAEVECEQLYRNIEEQEQHIRYLRNEKEVVGLAVWNIKNKRQVEKNQLNQKLLTEPPEKKKIRQRILGYFRENLRTLDYKHTTINKKLELERQKKHSNEQLIRELEYGISQACREVGKSSPEEIYEELRRGGEYRPVDPRALAQYGFRFGSADADKSTESSLLRVTKDRELQRLYNVDVQGHATYGVHEHMAAISTEACLVGNVGPHRRNNVQEENQDKQSADSAVDVYDAQGFPISPAGLSVRTAAHLDIGRDSTPSKVARVAVTVFPSMMR